jgi:hypothetical protein
MIFAALTFLLVAVLGSLAVAGVRAWRFWRTLQRASERTGGALERLAAQGAATEQRALGLTGNSERLEEATERLRRTLAAFAIIRTAAAEPRALYDSIIGAVPRK